MNGRSEENKVLNARCFRHGRASSGMPRSIRKETRRGFRPRAGMTASLFGSRSLAAKEEKKKMQVKKTATQLHWRKEDTTLAIRDKRTDMALGRPAPPESAQK